MDGALDAVMLRMLTEDYINLVFLLRRKPTGGFLITLDEATDYNNLQTLNSPLFEPTPYGVTKNQLERIKHELRSTEDYIFDESEQRKLSIAIEMLIHLCETEAKVGSKPYLKLTRRDSFTINLGKGFMVFSHKTDRGHEITTSSRATKLSFQELIYILRAPAALANEMLDSKTKAL